MCGSLIFKTVRLTSHALHSTETPETRTKKTVSQKFYIRQNKPSSKKTTGKPFKIEETGEYHSQESLFIKLLDDKFELNKISDRGSFLKSTSNKKNGYI